MAAGAQLEIEALLRDKASRGLQGLKGKLGGLASSIGTVLRRAAMVGVAGLAALGVMAFKAAMDLDAAFKAIRVGTGATGAKFDQLKLDFKEIAKSGPESFDEVANAVSQLNTLTGATGVTLQKMGRAGLDAARMTGENSGALFDAAGQTINRMNLEGADAVNLFDKLFVASQNTNVPMGKLATLLNDYGPVLTNLGLGLDNQIALFGQLEGAGLSVSRVMPGLNSFMRKLAGEGVTDLAGALENTLEEIKGATTASEALNIATEAFGAEGAQRMSVAVRSGKLDIADLAFELANAEGQISKTSDETKSWMDKLKELKNRIIIGVEPVLTKMVKLFETKVVPVIEEVGDALGNLARFISSTFKRDFKGMSDSYSQLPAKIRPIAISLMGLVKFIRDKLVPAFMDGVDVLKNTFLPILEDVARFIVNNKPIMIAAITAIGVAIVLAFGPGAVAVVAIVGLITLIGIMRNNWERFKPIVIAVGAALVPVGVMILASLVPAFIAWAVAAGAAALATLLAAAPIIALGLVIGGLVYLIVRHWDTIERITVGLWNTLRGIFTTMKDWLANNWRTIVLVALSILFPPGAGLFLLVTKAGVIRDKVLGAFLGVVTGIRGMFTGAFNAAKGLGEKLLEGLQTALSATGGFATNVAQAVLSAVKNVINTHVIDKINSALEFTIPVPGLPDIHIDPPNIPRLHAGALNIPRDMLAVLQKGEMVLSARNAESVRSGSAAQGGGGIHLHFASGSIVLGGSATREDAEALVDMVEDTLRKRRLRFAT